MATKTLFELRSANCAVMQLFAEDHGHESATDRFRRLALQHGERLTELAQALLAQRYRRPSGEISRGHRMFRLVVDEALGARERWVLDFDQTPPRLSREPAQQATAADAVVQRIAADAGLPQLPGQVAPAFAHTAVQALLAGARDQVQAALDTGTSPDAIAAQRGAPLRETLSRISESSFCSRTLRERQRLAADLAFQQMEFDPGIEVEESSGWSSMGTDRVWCTVYVRMPGADPNLPTSRIRVSVIFAGDRSAQVTSCKATDAVGTVVGRLQLHQHA